MIEEKNYNQKLLVEGNDDLHVTKAICEKFKITENFNVKDCKSISNLLILAPEIFLGAGIKTVGFILDADTDFKARWHSIRDILVKQGFQIPEELPSGGLIAKNNEKKAGVWIMPNNNLNGILENFLYSLVPQEDRLMPAINQTLDTFEQDGLVKYFPKDRPKAQMHSWLAMQENPGKPFGIAITSGYLSKDEETCLRFVKWLRELFIE